MKQPPAYEFCALTSNDICPDLVDQGLHGNHRSVVNHLTKQRYWLFESEEGRDLFLIKVSEGHFRRRGKRE